MYIIGKYRCTQAYTCISFFQMLPIILTGVVYADQAYIYAADTVEGQRNIYMACSTIYNWVGPLQLME